MTPSRKRARSAGRQILLLIAAGALAAKGAAAPTEYDVKAVFLFHFTQFVEWPEKAFPAPDAPFVIGVVGTDPFGGALAAVVRGEKVGRHPLVVRNVTDADAERACQILYVPRGSESLLFYHRLGKAPILTVGESDDFFKTGGIVQFFIDRRHVRLRIDLTQARSHYLVISAKLLRVAEVTQAGLPLAHPAIPAAAANHGHGGFRPF